MTNDIEIFGVGGSKMIAQGLKPIFNIKFLSIMGIFEVIYYLMGQLEQHWLLDR